MNLLESSKRAECILALEVKEGDSDELHFRRGNHDMISTVVNFFIYYIQETDQELRCTSQTLQYKTIKRRDLTDASDILLQEDIQTVSDSPYESPQVSRKH